MYYNVALPNFSRALLTYSGAKNHPIGSRVNVPFGKTEKIGIIVSTVKTPNLSPERLKPIIEVLDQEPLIETQHILFLQHLAKYYQISLNDLIISSLPKDSLQPQTKTDLNYYKKDNIIKPWHQWVATTRKNTLDKQHQSGAFSPVNHTPKPPLPSQPPKLSSAQRDVYNALKHTGPSLLWGVTGCGKTEIYIHLIHDALKQGDQVLLMVPEIALTPQVIHKIQTRLGITPTVLHSRQTTKNRLCQWLDARHGLSGLVIGTRSALLCPIKNLGLIIVDEEHDDAYRQEQSLFFSARDAAVLKASLLHIPIVLGSATPSLESLLNAQNEKYLLCKLFERYNAKKPNIHLVPLPQHTLISPALDDIVQQALAKNEHVMLYIGKRGYARLLKCQWCGFELRCPECDRLLVSHQSNKNHCHACEKSFTPPSECPKCHQSELSHYGAGSQRIAEIAQEKWPSARTLRIDTDEFDPQTAANALLDLNQQPSTIVVGTQMITKGHDIERLNTVVVINADHALYAGDFRAEEKLYAELLQVSGRSGRRDTQGHVYIQTQQKNHPLFQNLHTPEKFYALLLQKRKDFSLPPYAYIGCLYIRGSQPQIKKLLSLSLPDFPETEVLGPTLFPPGRKGKQECHQIMVSSIHRSYRNHCIRELYRILSQSLSKQTTILQQIDSHLSVS